jgi:heterodisulfide reductase subunit D
MTLEKVKGELFRCISCSECYGRGPNLPFRDGEASTPYWICPILEKFGFLTYSPQGLMFIANKVYYEHFPITEDMVQIYYSCVSCNRCGTQCTRPFLDIFRAMKEEMALSEVGPPAPVKKANENIRKLHNFMGAKPEARTQWAEGLNLPKAGELVYFAGCYGSFRYPNLSQATIRILRAAGIDVAYMGEEEWCCGMIPGWSGQPEIEAEMAKHNVEMLHKMGAKRVVIACAEGYRTFVKEYPKIVGSLPFEVVHTSQAAIELIRAGRLKLRKGVKEKVTYHDPCFLGRHCREYNAPRLVINSIPEIGFVEMEHNGLFADCCGSGAGVTGMSYPHLERQDAVRRLREAEHVAQTIVTTCPRCVENFNRSAKETDIRVNSIDLMELLARAL